MPKRKTADLGVNLNPPKPIKCVNCGRFKYDHLAKTYHCPVGSKHRTFGFTSFHKTDVYEPKPPKTKK